ncbi:MAG: response regulator [Chloroflexi bacterium]|nr:response regulator [Chloroflexota bacterium]
MTTPRLRLLIADDESIRLLNLKMQLESLGFEVIGEANDGLEAVDLAKRVRPDLIIMDIRMPNMDGIEAAKEITALQPVPIILITAFNERELAERASEAGIFGYLMKPVSENDLLPAIMLAMTRFKEFEEMRRDLADLRDALETRKLVEQAKGILMERQNLGEADAFRKLQQLSQRENKKMADIARAIIMASKLM